MLLLKSSDLYSAFRKDKSAMILVFSNVIVIIFALIQGWSLLIMMLGYWLQSVIIGFFNVLKIIDLKEFSVKGLKINNKKVEATQKTKMSIACFFFFHYGLFHLIYLFSFVWLVSWFVITEDKKICSGEEIFSISTMGIIFFLNHLFSFWYNRKEYREKKSNIGKIMFFPYARTIPMGLTVMAYIVFIIFGSIAGFELYLIPLVLFLLLKTLADLIMHTIEHREFN